MEKYPFREVAYCILPDHIHTIWTLPPDDCDYSIRWRAIKGLFTRWYHEQNSPGEFRDTSHQKRGETAIWQRRFWEHPVRHEVDFINHLDCIYYNPVKRNLVEHVRDWKWCSFERHVKVGFYPPDWGETVSPRIPEI